MLIIFYVIMSYLRMNVFEKEEWEVRMRRQRRMIFIEIGCSALKYTVSIDAYIMDSKTNRQIVFALMIFCIASMITASITSNTNNNINNNNLLAFAKKKKAGGSGVSSTSSSASSSSSSSTDSPIHTVKKVKTK